MAELKQTTSPDDGAEHNSTCLPIRRNSHTSEFSIFDGNDIPSDSPWSAFLTEGVDEDYSESEDVEMFEAAFQNRRNQDIYEDEAQDERPARRRNSGASMKEKVATMRRRSSRNSISSINSSFSNFSNYSAGSINEDFVPATRLIGSEITSSIIQAL